MRQPAHWPCRSNWFHRLSNESALHLLFCLPTTIRTINSDDIIGLIIAKRCSVTLRVPDMPLAVAIIVISCGSILRITWAGTARIGHVIVIAHGIVLDPGGSGL